MDDFLCEECGNETDDAEDCHGLMLCPVCAEEYWEAEDYEEQVRSDYRASVL